MLGGTVGQLSDGVLSRTHSGTRAPSLFDAAVVDVDANLVDPVFFEFWPFFFLSSGGGLDSLSSQFSHLHGLVAMLDGVFHELAHGDDRVDIVE